MPSDLDELSAALHALAAGKPHAAAAYVRQYGLPDVARERFAQALIDSTRGKEPTPRARHLFAAYNYYHEAALRVGMRKAFEQTQRKFNLPERVLDNTIRRKRSDVMALIREAES